MEEAEAVGESSGVPMAELATVEGTESRVVVRLTAAGGGRAVVLIVAVVSGGLTGEIGGEERIAARIFLCNSNGSREKKPLDRPRKSNGEAGGYAVATASESVLELFWELGSLGKLAVTAATRGAERMRRTAFRVGRRDKDGKDKRTSG